MITQIGSLPLEEEVAAVDYSFRHDIPFLPELPSRGDDMIKSVADGLEPICTEEFKKMVRKERPDTVKIQAAGPATMIKSGYEDAIVTALVYAQFRRMLDCLDAQNVIIFLDEPALGVYEGNYKAKWHELFSMLRADYINKNLVFGVHTCGNFQWDQLFAKDSGIDIVSFDASQFNPTAYANYAEFRSRGGRLSWGVKKAEDITDYREGDLITLTCGMHPKFYTAGECEHRYQLLRAIKSKVSGEPRVAQPCIYEKLPAAAKVAAP